MNLTFENVCVKNILNNVSFTAASGKVTVMVGKNGSGKTTALRAASGALKYSGKITAGERDLLSVSAKQAAKLVSLMPQILPAPQITVRELVRLGRFPYSGVYGSLSSEDEKKVSESLERAGVSELSARRVDRISGGERQRAFFALLLAQDTPVVMLDEAGAHLDAEGKRELNRDVRAIADSGKTVLCVMHDINDALGIADKIVLLDKGKLIFSGDAKEFCEKEYPEEIFSLSPYELKDGGVIYR